MGKKCGVKDPEINPAIERAARFFGYYVDKGAIPYGEHEAWTSHENNGKNSMAAVMFAAMENRVKESQYFSKMVTASYQNREYGHTGQGFSYLWSALGANAGGPDALAAFFGHASWHLDLVRRCDGSFTYDGSEQYGAGKTDDNTYYGNSSYNGLSPTASYVLTYSAPLKKLCITGKDSSQEKWLSKKDVAEAIASGCFDLDRQTLSVEELMTALGDWSPIARGWAAEELSKRPNSKDLAGRLITMAESPDVRKRLGAVEALSYIQTPDALPVLVRALSHDDRGLRFKAAQALRKMGGQAKSAVPGILSAVATTAEPLQPINWADPIQITQGQLAAALFQTPLSGALQEADRKQVRLAIRAISRNADGMARATLRGFFENQLTLEDVEALAPDILAAVETRCPADTMFGCEIRMGGLRALTKYHFVEAIAAGVTLAKTQGGHGSQKRTLEIMNEITSFGTAARSAIPGLKEVIVVFNDQCKNNEFPSGELNEQRISAITDAIRTIETSTTQPKLRKIRGIAR
jgi:HEAT repeat protein